MKTNDWIATLLRSNLSSTQRLVGLVMAHHANWKSGTNIWASQTTIGNEAGLSRDAVLNAIKVLVAEGYLSLREARPGTTSVYDLTIPVAPNDTALSTPTTGVSRRATGAAVHHDTNTPTNTAINTPTNPPTQKSNKTGIIQGLSALHDAIATWPHSPSPTQGAGVTSDVASMTSTKAPSQDRGRRAPLDGLSEVGAQGRAPGMPSEDSTNSASHVLASAAGDSDQVVAEAFLGPQDDAPNWDAWLDSIEDPLLQQCARNDMEEEARPFTELGRDQRLKSARRRAFYEVRERGRLGTRA